MIIQQLLTHAKKIPGDMVLHMTFVSASDVLIQQALFCKIAIWTRNADQIML